MKNQVMFCVLILVVFSVTVSSCNKSESSSPSGTTGDYTVFAWNDLGMHCLNPTYDKLVILPPYNNVLVQVVKRGNPPSVVTSDIAVSYKLTNNSTSYNKRAYGGFWDNAFKLFGVTLTHDIGLKGNGLAGNMTVYKTTIFMHNY